jgi:hypothetical protein
MLIAKQGSEFYLSKALKEDHEAKSRQVKYNQMFYEYARSLEDLEMIALSSYYIGKRLFEEGKYFDSLEYIKTSIYYANKAQNQMIFADATMIDGKIREKLS